LPLNEGSAPALAAGALLLYSVRGASLVLLSRSDMDTPIPTTSRAMAIIALNRFGCTPKL